MFGCADCGAILTAAVSEVALPVHLTDAHWEELHRPLLEAGSYAVDPEPYGPPWRQWGEIPVAALLGPALGVLLPAGKRAKRLDLAGPGYGEPAAELVLVPIHPQTGDMWPPRTGAVPVPVDPALWAELAFPPRRTRLPVVGGLLAGVERDDPLPPHPWYPFRPSREAFRRTLARLPAVREPWLRAVYDRTW
ncbi:hypothetical protein ACWCPT_24990 [Streptomyces sp. NPDC002308]